MNISTREFSIPPAVMFYHHHLSEAEKARKEKSIDLVLYHETEAQKIAVKLMQQGYRLTPPVRPS